MIWNDIKKKKPLATESGNWDGLRSDNVLICTTSRQYYIARMYEGALDSHEFCDFYTNDDYEIENVAFWAEIDLAPI